MDWALVLHHFRAWAWWFLPFVVVVYVAVDYVSFLRQKRQRVHTVEEVLRLGFGQVYQADNVQTAAALLGDTAAQESVAASFGGDIDDITYGELDLKSIAKLMHALESLRDMVQLPARPRLIDLGSGNGRAVMAMAMMRPFALCEGVEISPALHSSALRHLSLFESIVRPQLPAERGKVMLRLRCADMLQADLTRADIVFALSTAFSTDTMAKLFQHASSMRHGAVLILADQPTLSSKFACVSELSYRSESGTRGDASWGKGTLRVLVRRSHGGKRKTLQ